jgi:hypothetical protein
VEGRGMEQVLALSRKQIPQIFFLRRFCGPLQSISMRYPKFEKVKLRVGDIGIRLVQQERIYLHALKRASIISPGYLT